jgi:predicted TIM-barrel fold metal-dependent hydrolase
MKNRIIDFRLRPPTCGYPETEMFRSEIVEWVYNLVGVNKAGIPESVRQRNVEMLLGEMDEAGIRLGVVTGRHRPGTELSNDKLAELYEKFPGRFVVFASVDVLNASAGHEQIRHALDDLGFHGVAMDLSVLGIRVDDANMYRFYDQISSYHAPLTITLSSFGARDLNYVDPVALDRAARDFPDLQFVATHANYPYVFELLAVAAKRENIWLQPDVYMSPNVPGGSFYFQAANSYLRERFLFASAYPYASLSEAVSC